MWVHDDLVHNLAWQENQEQDDSTNFASKCPFSIPKEPAKQPYLCNGDRPETRPRPDLKPPRLQASATRSTAAKDVTSTNQGTKGGTAKARGGRKCRPPLKHLPDLTLTTCG